MPRLIGVRERSHQPVWDTLLRPHPLLKLSWRSRAYRFVLLKLLPDRLRWRWLVKRRIRLLSTIEQELNRDVPSGIADIVYMMEGIRSRDVQ